MTARPDTRDEPTGSTDGRTGRWAPGGRSTVSSSSPDRTRAPSVVPAPRPSAAPCAPPSGVPAEVLTAVVELAPGPLLVLDRDGTVLLANAAARTLAGRDPVGTTLPRAGLLAADAEPAGARQDASQWTGPTGRRRLHGWTDTLLPDGRLLVTAVDHTVRHHDVEGLRTAATTDALTGLPNRAALLQALREALAAGGPVTVLFADLDGFKAVNDGHGHAVGDLLLQTVATRLQRSVRGDDLVARLGGDEFVVVSRGLSAADGTRLVRRLVANVAQPLVLPQGVFTIGVSIGLAVGEPGSAPESLLAHADGEMYRAKSWRPGRTGQD